MMEISLNEILNEIISDVSSDTKDKKKKKTDLSGMEQAAEAEIKNAEQENMTTSDNFKTSDANNDTDDECECCDKKNNSKHKKEKKNKKSDKTDEYDDTADDSDDTNENKFNKKLAIGVPAALAAGAGALALRKKLKAAKNG